MRVALATCVNLPEVDVDEPLLLEALARRGVQTRMLAWDDTRSSPDPGELVVIRSTWNYYRDLEGFLAWVTRTSATTRLLNPAALVLGNARKTYLRDLERRGIAVVPTEYVAQGEQRTVAEIVEARDWANDKLVIKPVVSAGSYQTQSFAADDRAGAEAFLAGLARERDVMVQRWMPSVETYGERCLVWIDGALTHAIRKAPRFIGSEQQVSGEQPIQPEERAFAEKLLEPIAKDLLYARIDVVWDHSDRDGSTLRLMELELIEPSLFLNECPRAIASLADAIVRHARQGLA